MAELADAGAAAFTDDGLPVARRRACMRQALQYQRLAGARARAARGGPVAVGGRRDARGRGLGAARPGGHPVGLRVDDGRARHRARRLRGRPHPRPARLRARDGRGRSSGPRRPGVQVTAEATPHHLLLTDEAVRSLDTHFKMNPPLRTEADRQALIDGLRSGVLDCIATDHAPHSREEKEEPFELAPMGVTGPRDRVRGDPHRPRAARRARPRPGRRADDRRRRAVRPPRARRSPRAPRRTSAWSTSTRSGRSARPATRAARPTAPSRGRRLTGRVRMTIAAGAVAFRERSFAIEAVR